MSVHHFIMSYDTNTNEWSWDTESEEARFKGCIYLPELDKWVSSDYSTELYDMDNEVSEQLSKAIFYLNKA